MVKRIKKEREDFIMNIDTLKEYSTMNILKRIEKERRKRERGAKVRALVNYNLVHF